MIVWTAERGEGKSAALIHWALQKPERRVILVANMDRVREMRNQVHKLFPGPNADHVQILTFRAFPTWRRGRRTNDLEVAVDEVADLIHDMVGVIPEIVTGPAIAMPLQHTGHLPQEVRSR